MCNTSWNHDWHHRHNKDWGCDDTWSNSCDCDSSRPSTLTVQVLDTRCGALLCCDCENGQQVQVNTDDACSYSVGDRLCVYYDGTMTKSLPPQITATSIRLLRSSSSSCSNSCSCS